MLVAHGIDDHIVLEYFTARGFQTPATLWLKRGAGDPRVQVQVGVQPERRRAARQVSLNFRLIDEAGAPVRVGGIGKRVGMGPDIAGQPRIRMQAPGAAGGVQGVENRDLLKALPQQFPATGNSCWSGADHCDAQGGKVWHGVAPVSMR